MTQMHHTHPRTERLEARITLEQKSLFQHAANVAGKTLTDFAISALQEAATEVIQEHEIIQLSLQDQRAFADAIFNSPKPNNVLLQAAKRHKKEVKR